MKEQDIQSMRDAAREIRRLRDEVRMLRAQMEVVEVFAGVIGLRKERGMVAAIDIAWQLDERARDLEEQGVKKE